MLKLVDIDKRYRSSEVETRALHKISLEVEAGEFLAVMGPSGCGKSTLLNILGLLTHPDGGEYWFFGEQVSRAPERRLAELRRSGVGFIFQSFNLIDDLNVMENVEVALLYQRLGQRLAGQRIPGRERRRRAAAALERVGMGHRARHLPRQLSGGQQQRVAIARALVSEPRMILADEPSGNLDTENGNAVMDELAGVNRTGTTIVMVTHSLVHADRAQRTLKLLDGQLVSTAQRAAVAPGQSHAA